MNSYQSPEHSSVDVTVRWNREYACDRSVVVDTDVLIASLYFDWRNWFSVVHSNTGIRFVYTDEVYEEISNFPTSKRGLELTRCSGANSGNLGARHFELSKLTLEETINAAVIAQECVRVIGESGRSAGEASCFASALIKDMHFLYNDSDVEILRRNVGKIINAIETSLSGLRADELRSRGASDSFCSTMKDPIVMLVELGCLDIGLVRDVQRQMNERNQGFPTNLNKYVGRLKTTGLTLNSRRHLRRASLYWRRLVQEFVSGDWVTPGSKD